MVGAKRSGLWVMVCTLVYAALGMSADDNATRERKAAVAALQQFMTKLETAAALGEDIPAAEKQRILKSFKGLAMPNLYRAFRILGGAPGMAGWRQQAARTDIPFLREYTRAPVDGRVYPGGSSFDLHHRKLVNVLAKAITSLDEAGYDYSWFAPRFLMASESVPTLKELSADLAKHYKQSKALRKLGLAKGNADMLRLAVVKLRLIEGYKDSEKLFLEAKKDLSALLEKQKTETASEAQAAELAEKATEEEIAAERKREEALRLQKLRVEEERAATARAKAAAEQAKKTETELAAFAKEHEAELKKLKNDRTAAANEKVAADQKAAESRKKAAEAIAAIRKKKAEEAAKAQQAAEAQKREQEAKLRGKAPETGHGGSVYAVKAYLKQHLKDSGSLDIIAWGKPFEHGAFWLVPVKYRAKNSFGAYVIEQKTAYMQDGVVKLMR